MKKIPEILIYSRIFYGILILSLAIFHCRYYTIIALILMGVGLISDVFDGIIARKLGISTEKLRRLDSVADQAFWILIAVSAYINCPDFFKENNLKIFALISSEILIYLVSYFKFNKEVDTHAISSKIWTLLLFSALFEIIYSCDSGTLFNWCIYVGLLTRLEIILITLILPRWTNDVPSIYHAILIKKGKEIKRNKFFNG